MESSPGPAMEFLGRVAYELTTMRPMMPTYLHLLVSAIFPIYTAAHASLSRPSSAAKPEKKSKSAGIASDDEDEVMKKIEGLSPSDAIFFPIMAGATLASLYFLLKWLQDPSWLNWALGIYFSWIGLFFATKFLKDVFSVARSIFLPMQYSAHDQVWKWNGSEDEYRVLHGSTKPAVLREGSPLPGLLRKLPLTNFASKSIWKIRKAVYSKAQLHLHIHKFITFKSPIDSLDVTSFIASSIIVYWHTFVSKPWFLTNFLGFSFCYGSLQLVTPTTAWTGTLLLCALFFYDIYFVFFTPMMVTVATKLDVPIKLLFPRPDGCILPVGAGEGSVEMNEYLQCLAKKRTMAMLGLGDIVIPGMILAFALRFDLYMFYLQQAAVRAEDSGKSTAQAIKPKYFPATGSWGERFWTSKKSRSTDLKAKSFPKTYFNATVGGYLLGMITTVVVMQVAEHAQPALLYLVPGVLISLWGTALIKGDLKQLWNYMEDGEDDPKDMKDGKEKDKKHGNDEKRVEKSDAPDKTENLENRPVESEANGKLEVASSKASPINPPAALGDKKDDEKSSAKSDPEKDCRQLFSLSITLPGPAPSSSAVSASSQTSSSLDNQILTVSSTITADTEKDDGAELLPDVAADQAVLAKLQKEVSASCAETVDAKGGEPPGKRRRKA